MAKDAEKEVLESICTSAAGSGFISEDERQRLKAVFGERFERAIKSVEQSRVKKYTFKPSGRVVWIVVGREKEYEILPEAEYCSCDDFYFHVISTESGYCYHLIAQKLANALGQAELVEEGDEFFVSLMSEWRNQALRPDS